MTSGLVKLDDVSFQRLLRECNDHQILMLLQALDAPLRSFVFRNMSHRRQAFFVEELEALPSAGAPRVLLEGLRQIYDLLDALEAKGEVILRGLI